MMKLLFALPLLITFSNAQQSARKLLMDADVTASLAAAGVHVSSPHQLSQLLSLIPQEIQRRRTVRPSVGIEKLRSMISELEQCKVDLEPAKQIEMQTEIALHNDQFCTIEQFKGFGEDTRAEERKLYDALLATNTKYNLKAKQCQEKSKPCTPCVVRVLGSSPRGTTASVGTGQLRSGVIRLSARGRQPQGIAKLKSLINELEQCKVGSNPVDEWITESIAEYNDALKRIEEFKAMEADTGKEETSLEKAIKKRTEQIIEYSKKQKGIVWDAVKDIPLNDLHAQLNAITMALETEGAMTTEIDEHYKALMNEHGISRKEFDQMLHGKLKRNKETSDAAIKASLPESGDSQ